ncbi:MAG TPA: tRNA(His) guanylyltransferase Thg1 family protein [Phycisphaerae bacterium]|nr:tRNA(His) guanylyltransferase Thg1 family protein [Phycisphaerae bacterium]HRW51381.1 tRNA(His) guanylyltransferase Thg1 family protein [Phycisphaerae bacterium]
MKFDELENRMRRFETSADVRVPPGVYIVARLDGRSFTRLTRERFAFEAPCDERFRDAMLETCEGLMEIGFRTRYAYSQSDEISLLFDPEDDTFGRRLRKWNSILAGEASARMSLALGDIAVFDCRICQLPRVSDVVDYFRWRSEDAARNALNSHCYWRLRSRGRSAAVATRELLDMSVAARNELLFSEGLNFNDLPDWQKRGFGLRWEDFEKEATNPGTGERVRARRRRIRRDLSLPMKDAYSDYVAGLLGMTIDES